jgi:hypothetical protein
MKKMIFTISCIFLMNASSCFSQLSENSKKEYKSATRFVYGYSNDFNELVLGITFGKILSSADTVYYIKFQLSAPASEFRNDIEIKKMSAITFLSKSGKRIDLNLTDVIPSTEKVNEEQNDDPVSTVKSYHYTTLVLYVTKDKLIEICAEPFYNLIIPYYNSSSQVEDRAIFVKPTLFVPRSFTQKSIMYILYI